MPTILAWKGLRTGVGDGVDVFVMELLASTFHSQLCIEDVELMTCVKISVTQKGDIPDMNVADQSS
jgi:hypothetical protein